QTAVAHRGTPVVTATGEPSELLLFAFGRQNAARVELEGEQDAISKVSETKQLGF
ncbi:TIGR03085 family protein, partial [Streptomyces spiralis]